MTFDQLQYFITIAKTGNMTRAAEQLNVVQPALSRAIKRLETELDVKLFDRTGKSVVLNANGNVHIGARKGNVNVGLSKLADGSGYLYVTVDVGYDDDTEN